MYKSKKLISFLVSFSLILTLNLSTVFAASNSQNNYPSSNAQDKNLDSKQKVETDMNTIVNYDKDGYVLFNEDSFDKFANKYNLSKDERKDMDKGIKELFKEAKKQGLTINKDGIFVKNDGEVDKINDDNNNDTILYSATAAHADGTYMLGVCVFDSYFNRSQVEKILSNINTSEYIFAGVSLVGFKWTAVGMISGLAGLALMQEADAINSAFSQSNYYGCILHSCTDPHYYEHSWRPRYSWS